MEEGKIIIPILIDKDCKIPFRLRTYHHIDLTDYTTEKGYTEGLERIAKTLREVAEQIE